MYSRGEKAVKGLYLIYALTFSKYASLAGAYCIILRLELLHDEANDRFWALRAACLLPIRDVGVFLQDFQFTGLYEGETPTNNEVQPHHLSLGLTFPKPIQLSKSGKVKQANRNEKQR